MTSSCFHGIYTFEACCVLRQGHCWDADHNYDSCCQAAKPFERYLGDPSCWVGGGAFYSYEQCCGANSNHCWGWDGRRGMEFSFERCCGLPVPPEDAPTDRPAAELQHCQLDIEKPELGLWSSRSFEGGSPRQEWDFKRLVTVTALRLFHMPDVPATEVTGFRGSAELWVDGGLGMRRYWAVNEVLEIGTAPGSPLYVTIPLEPFDAYRLQLRVRDWDGSDTLLWAVPLGCDTSKQPADVSLVYCWPQSASLGRDEVSARHATGGSMASKPKDSRKAARLLGAMYGWMVKALTAKDVAGCFLRMDQTLRELEKQRRQAKVASILLSPFLLDLGLQLHGMKLRTAVEILYKQDADAMSVVGFPILDSTGKWSMPLRKIRRQYWKLLYSRYPTGSARRLRHGVGSAVCHGGDAVSGTRVYRPTELSKLLKHVDPVGDAGWFVNLDLEAVKQGVSEKTFLCLTGIMPEEDYLLHADLTTQLATRYEVEAALFHEHAGLRVNCPITVRHQRESKDYAYIFDLINDKGLVAPWCFRRALREGWRRLTLWWSSVSSRHFVVASDGTGLAMFRNPVEPIPWDMDVDMQLFSEHEAEIGLDAFVRWRDGGDVPAHSQAFAQLRELGFALSNILDYGAKGAGIHLSLIFRDNSTRPAAVELDMDAVLKSYILKSSFPFTVDFAGVTVRFGLDLQEMLARKYGPAEKQMRKIEGVLRCLEPGHNACLPHCNESSTASAASARVKEKFEECEFEDNFVEIDNWG
eukprot:TRINITY_DN59855_c0_g1_i1.p1 TRINITY_DN59855_c0_g1~~TRINITY_DN59855_c0_g1_i1.p1  ORF type:complete len:753 (-),score=163.47 TRINITY_DN59855_c0_g1_i1:123-2381(-)